MPISSGALEWPKSYFRKPVETEAESSRTDEGLEWWWGVKSPRGVAPLNYEWQPQLSAREDYEKWRKEMDRKVGFATFITSFFAQCFFLSFL